MPTRRYRKPYRLKRKKSIFRNRFFWLSILIILFLGWGIFFLFFSQYFQIKDINIAGNQKVLKQDLDSLVRKNYSQKLLFILPAQNILLFNSKATEREALKAYPQINSISVKKKLPGTIKIKVSERFPIGIWCKNNVPCFYFDQEGIIFEEIPEGTSHALIIKELTDKEGIKLGERIIDKNLSEACLKIQNELANFFEIEILSYLILSDEKIDAQTNQGWKIYFNQKEDLNLQLTKLIAVLENEIPPEKRSDLEYIDLRFSRVYYLNKQVEKEAEAD